MLRQRRLQEKVASSRYSLPISAILISLVWVAVSLLVGEVWLQFVLTGISTLMMVELNNQNSLMRTYSRMVSCSFLFLITASGLPSPPLDGSVVTLCAIAFHLVVWHSYQDRRAPGFTFYAYLCLGIASICFVQVLFYLPFLWIMMLKHTLSWSWRNFFASIIGILTPYWFWGAYLLFVGDLDYLTAHLLSIADYQGFLDYSQVTLQQVLNIGFIVFLAVVGVFHFVRTSYADKIRTRMIYNSFIMNVWVTLAFIVLQPRCVDMLGGVLIVNTSPLVAHYITYTHSRFSNICFIALLVLVVALLGYNILMPPLMLLPD